MNKREAKALLTIARKLSEKISDEYNKISPDSKYHDALYYQHLGAIESVYEIEDDIDRGEYRFISEWIETLETTLESCKLANEIESLHNKLNFQFG